MTDDQQRPLPSERQGRQIVIRLDDELYDALVRDAAENERGVSQSVRYYLKRALLIAGRPSS